MATILVILEVCPKHSVHMSYLLPWYKDFMLVCYLFRLIDNQQHLHNWILKVRQKWCYNLMNIYNLCIEVSGTFLLESVCVTMYVKAVYTCKRHAVWDIKVICIAHFVLSLHILLLEFIQFYKYKPTREAHMWLFHESKMWFHGMYHGSKLIGYPHRFSHWPWRC